MNGFREGGCVPRELWRTSLKKKAKKVKEAKKARITIRPAVSEDAQKIGAVFDAAVFAGWTYLGELAKPYPLRTDRVVFLIEPEHAWRKLTDEPEGDSDGDAEGK